ncbi:MAG TPA: hypothetical protein VKA76_04985 [Gammaproteobacteria bacterium]|nr:hypothetical protein [Gammaproteobacteria bacterium]
MHGTIPDFTDNELWAIETTLRERYGEPKEIQLAESELRLDPHSAELSSCPTVYWTHDNCHFVICKTDDHRYRAQFFYRLYQMFGTGVDEFDNVAECAVTLLQMQADHERKESEERPDRA